MTMNPNAILVFFALLATLLFAARILVFAAKMRSARQSDERLRVLESKVEAISRHLNLSNEIPLSPPIPAPFESRETSAWNQNNTVSANAISANATSTDEFSPHLSSASAQVSDEIRRLLRDRQKIAAIKLMRQHSHIGLKEAKDAVDAIEKTL